MSPKVTERARTLPKNKSTAITSALTKADIIAVLLLSEDGLALSVIASQCHLSQMERLWLTVKFSIIITKWAAHCNEWTAR